MITSFKGNLKMFSLQLQKLLLIDLFSRHSALYTTRNNFLLDQKQPGHKLLRCTSYLVLLEPKEIEQKKKET